MEAIVLQENLSKVLQTILKFTPSKPQLPILSSILIEAKDAQLVFSTTDLRMSARVRVGGKVLKEGKFVLAGKPFAEYILSLSPGSLTMKEDGGELYIEGEGIHTRFQGMNVEDFPQIPTIEGEGVELPAESFAHFIEMGGLASGIDETRPVFSSILLEFEDGIIKSISTDGYRLSGWSEKVKNVKSSTSILVPARFTKETAHIVERSNQQMFFYPLQSGKMLGIKQGDAEFYLRTIEGDFPDYHAIVPPEFSIEVVVDVEPFLQALKTAAVFSRDASNIVKIEIEDKKMIVRATSVTLGEHVSEIPIEIQKGEKGNIAFNGKYLMELLSNVHKDKLWFGMNEELKPGMFRSEDEHAFFYLVMPFKVQDQS